MFGPIIVSAFAASLIAVYMLIVNNCFLRRDDHYYSPGESPDQVLPQRPVSVTTTKPAHA